MDELYDYYFFDYTAPQEISENGQIVRFRAYASEYGQRPTINIYESSNTRYPIVSSTGASSVQAEVEFKTMPGQTYYIEIEMDGSHKAWDEYVLYSEYVGVGGEISPNPYTIETIIDDVEKLEESVRLLLGSQATAPHVNEQLKKSIQIILGRVCKLGS